MKAEIKCSWVGCNKIFGGVVPDDLSLSVIEDVQTEAKLQSHHKKTQTFIEDTTGVLRMIEGGHDTFMVYVGGRQVGYLDVHLGVSSKFIPVR
jgi:hypothetical protein